MVRVCLAEGIALIFKENNRDFVVRRTFKEAFIAEALVENLAFIQAHRSLKLCSHDIECKSSQIKILLDQFYQYVFQDLKWNYVLYL